MRITNNMISASTMRNINQAANRLAEANERVSSQKKISLASDDPVVATRAVTYRSYLAKIAQYKDNAEAASGWQKTTDTALSDLSDVIQNAREVTVQAANSATMNDSDLTAIKDQIAALRDEAISIMNTTYAGRYVFGGYNTSEAPYKLVSTALGDAVTFKGDYLSLGGAVSADNDDADIISFCTDNAGSLYATTEEQNISYNVGFSSDIAVNIEGQDVIGEGGGSNLFDTFSKLLLALGGDTSYKTASADASGTVTVTTNDLDISSLLGDLDTDYDRLLSSQATLGARMDHVNTVSDSLDDAKTTYTALMSDNEDVDTAEASTEQTTAEYVYQAALSVGAKVITKSLIDYIA